MRTRSMIGMAALMGCLFASAATAAQRAQGEAPKSGEPNATADKPARQKGAAEKTAGKRKSSAEHITDANGQRIREQFVDSKGKVVPYKDVPLKDTFLCYPPPEGPHPGGKEAKIADVPGEYRCVPMSDDPRKVLRVLLMSCTRTCRWPNTPDIIYCC
jgi:hypothetical protein